MAYNINFDSTLFSEDGGIVIKGTSEPLGDDVRLVSRHVVLRQDPTGFIEAGAPGTLEWATEPQPAQGFTTGDALAIGTETHVVMNAASRDVRATFVTVNWSQIVGLQLPGES